MQDEIIFDEKKGEHFRNWLELDLESVSWQGRYETEFLDFWKNLFASGRSLKELHNLLLFIAKKAPKGPLATWILWLDNRLLCFIYVHDNLSIGELAEVLDIELSEVATRLRNFFSEVYPQYEESFNNFFQLSHVINESIHMKFNDVTKTLALPDDYLAVREHELMSGIEITLYPEWHELNEWLKEMLLAEEKKRTRIKKNLWEKRPEYIKAVREVLLLIIAALVLLYLVKTFNGWYEKYLAEKIQIYEPQFLWTDKTLAFQNPEAQKKAEASLPHFVDLENININFNTDSERAITEKDPFVTESEVSLASVESLPTNLDSAQGDSNYEEKNKVGIREDLHSNKKAYRMMIKSSNIVATRSYIDEIMKKYSATKADKVSPGTYVPGGLYYNLFIPKNILREFLAEVSSETEATLYESRARFDNPPGKSKVLVWVKVF